MQQMEEDNYALIIADDGVGLPPDFDINKYNSLGMSLMKGLSKQLNGNFELKDANGLAIYITFANEPVSKPFAKSSEMQFTA
jgi:two-component sensor histidine kinase